VQATITLGNLTVSAADSVINGRAMEGGERDLLERVHGKGDGDGTENGNQNGTNNGDSAGAAGKGTDSPPTFKQCFVANFTFSFSSANSPFLTLAGMGPSIINYVPGLPTSIRKAAGYLTGGAVARSTGLTTLRMAAPDLLEFEGVANLGVMGTVGSVVANGGVNALLAGAAYETGVAIGATAYATGQAIAGNNCK
jgi:hypothetical protein